MTNAERKLLDTLKERAWALREYQEANKAVKQAEADYSKANEAYQKACAMHVGAMAVFEAEVLDGGYK